MTATATKTAQRSARAAIHDALTTMARHLDAILGNAQKPGSAEHQELSVRRSMRLAQDIARKAIALRSVRDPEPWITAPTRERAGKTQGDPKQEVVMVAGGAIGIAHRWAWPVKSMQDRHLLTVHQVTSGARIRAAFDASQFHPGTFGYGERQGPRSGLQTPADEARINRQIKLNEEHGDNRRITLAGEEFTFISARLEEELKAVVWCLVLEQPLPGEDAPLSAVEFGRRMTQLRSDDYCRWYALGALKVTLVRLSSIYRQWDFNRRQVPEQRRTG